MKKPKVLLLDEPLSALDAKLREAMRFELSQLQQKVGITFIMVTHDQTEALAIACRVAVMNKGSIAQLGTPSDLYEFPASRFVADFIGSVNMFEGKLIDDKPDEAIVACPELEPYPVQVPHGVPGKEDSSVWVAIRPEKMNLHKYADAPPAVPECPAAHNVAKGEIKDISYLGDISIYHVLLANGRLIRISRPNRSRWDQDNFAAGEEGLGELGRIEPGRAPVLSVETTEGSHANVRGASCAKSRGRAARRQPCDRHLCQARQERRDLERGRQALHRFRRRHRRGQYRPSASESGCRRRGAAEGVQPRLLPGHAL